MAKGWSRKKKGKLTSAGAVNWHEMRKCRRMRERAGVTQR